MQQILWAPPDFQSDLVEELRRKGAHVLSRHEDLFLIESDQTDFVWIEAQGLRAERVSFSSIGEGQKLLRERGKLWCPSPRSHFRRSELLAQDLLQPKTKKRRYLEKIARGPLGAFCLVGENEMWVSPELRPAVPPGAWDFEESTLAPSRAYLKLWELFTREGFAPKNGEHCVELGSAPGGWTWVLAERGCRVTAVDKGDMNPEILKNPRVEWRRQDAFSLKAAELGPVDWLFSDLICYPSKLLELVRGWMDADLARNFVCTIKFQGETDFATLDAFLRIPGSKALHLRQNKHEVTWFKCSDA